MDIERQSMDVDIACVGFGPATAGFLHTLSQAMVNPDGTPAFTSKAMEGMPPQVICYERADDPGFGVSGVATRARGLSASLSEDQLAAVPMATRVKKEKVAYLFDPHGASRRSPALKAAEAPMRFLAKDHAFELPYIPPFLRKDEGWVLSLGQFSQWVNQEIMGHGMVQVWPSTPVSEPLIEADRVAGVRLCDQGVDKKGEPDAGYMPGMDIKARLTVVGDGPVGPVGRAIDDHFGMPEGHHRREWALGMKMVVDLPEGCELAEGTVLHTLGYPEPEIFGFLYVMPENVASLGIFVPSWFDSPVRTAYRYLHHWMTHPWLWKHLKGGIMRSWGAKSLLESGRRGEPHLAGNGYARLGEGSGTTNVLTGSGVDEAWTSGVQLAEAVVEILRQDKDFTAEELERTYVARRRASWVDREAREAEKARDGFTRGVVTGLVGMALSGLTKGRLNAWGNPLRPWERIPTLKEYFRGRIPVHEIERIQEECKREGRALHPALMERAGWPAIEYDGQLLVSHQDALLMGGKVQAPPGYADHVIFKNPAACEACRRKVCIEACSGQAIAMNPDSGVPLFDREKCIHCGACLWNCSQPDRDDPELTNVAFKAGAGGLHSAEN